LLDRDIVSLLPISTAVTAMALFKLKYVARISILFLAAGALKCFAQDGAENTASTLDSLEKKVAYLIGYSVAQQISSSGLDIDEAAMTAAFEDVMKGNDLKLSEEDRNIAMRMFELKLKEAKALTQLSRAIVKGQKFLQLNAGKDGVNTLPSGVQYKVLKAGAGEVKAATEFSLRFTARLVDGTEVEREEVQGVSANDLVAGLAEAVQLMADGAEWEVYVPHHLAYPNGTLSVPEGSVLIYVVERLAP